MGVYSVFTRSKFCEVPTIEYYKNANIQLLTYVEVDMKCYWAVNVILTDAERMSIWLSLLFNNTPCLPKHKSIIVLLYNKCMLCISCHFRPLKPLTLRMDHAKWLDVLTSLPVSHAILPRAVCFATSRPANHAICSFIDSSGYASGPIRICLFIDYIINGFITWHRARLGVI